MTNQTFANCQFVYVIFFKNNGRKGYACFSFMKEGDQMLIGTSYCSPHDKFEKWRAKRDAVNYMLQERQYEIDANFTVCDLVNQSIGFVRHFLDMQPTETKHRPLPSWARSATPSLTLGLDWMSPKQFVAMNSVRFYLAKSPTNIFIDEDNYYADFEDFNVFCKVAKVKPDTIKNYMGEKH